MDKTSWAYSSTLLLDCWTRQRPRPLLPPVSLPLLGAELASSSAAAVVVAAVVDCSVAVDCVVAVAVAVSA